mgnify:FL=1
MLFSDILILIKFRITILVIVTAYLGYYLGLRFVGFQMTELSSIIIFFHLIIGISLTSSSSGILNQYLESDLDLNMKRTVTRPLPQNIIN